MATARTPNLDRLIAQGPSTQLQAHGTAAGLPTDGDMGNSEVGHNAIGAGRVFDQGAKLVNAALRTGSLWTTEVWQRLIAGRTLHLIGLVSNGNVHSHIDHLHALIARAATDGVQRLRVHVLTDGRDVAARSALEWVEPLEARLSEHRAAGRDYRIASGGGRMHITMDRYNADWEMVGRGWACHVRGEGRPFATAPDAIRTLYADDPEVNDQFLPAFAIVDDGAPVGPIRDGDAVLFFNFRGDRAIEISRAFDEDDFAEFDRGERPDVFYAGMMQYDGDLQVPNRYLVAPPQIDRTVGEYLAAAGLRSFVCAETQKYGHVTYFFNGNRSGRIDEALEEYVEVPSTTLPLEERPWMSAAEVTDHVVRAIESGRFDHVRLNYANGDMVGHTGALEPTRLALEVVDLQLARLRDAVDAVDGILMVTADHGNADQMWLRNSRTGEPKRDAAGQPVPCTSHSLNPVPFAVFDPRNALSIRPSDTTRGLAAIGTTVLELCGLQPPADYVDGLVR